MIVSMIIQVIFNVFIYRNIYINNKTKQIEKTYKILESDFTDDAYEIFKLVEKPQMTYNLRISVKLKEKVIYSNYREVDKSWESKDKDGDQSIDITQRKSSDGKKIIALKKKGSISYKGEVYDVSIISRLTGINDNIMLFTQSSVVISLVITLLGTLIYTVFASRVSSIIKNVEVVANKVSNLEFEERANEKIFITELMGLSKSINTMSDRLDDNIKKLRTANDELNERVDYKERVDQMRKSFIANASHEMKTPLSIIMMYSESLKNNVSDIDRDYYLETIIEESQRLNHMVMQLLDVSQIEKGLYQVSKENVDLSELTGNIIEKSKLILKDYNFVSQIDENIEVIGDGKYLRQAMDNYISNAKAHTKKGDMIKITLEKSGENAIYKVFNEGEHISEKDMPYIWDSFFGRSESVEEEVKRIGLGLYIVRTIVQAHEGGFCAENKPEGVEFWISLKIDKG